MSLLLCVFYMLWFCVPLKQVRTDTVHGVEKLDKCPNFLQEAILGLARAVA